MIDTARRSAPIVRMSDDDVVVSELVSYIKQQIIHPYFTAGEVCTSNLDTGTFILVELSQVSWRLLG